MINTTFETKEQGLEELRKAVAIRNTMGGALYWNIVNDDCLNIANRLVGMGVTSSEIQQILNT